MDPTVVAIPGYFGSMGAEYLYLKRRAEQQGPSAADYERNDTITSLAMGVASLIAPLVMPKVLGPVTPGAGRFGKALVGVAAGAVAVTTVADRLAKLDDAPGSSATATTADAPGDTPNRRRRRRIAEAARKVAKVGGVASIVAGGVAITSTWTHRTNAGRLWERRVLPDLGNGPLALLAAVIGWDFIYYWNHRFMHEARYMWAIHVVHHSSERYNLSTALRQPVADAFGTFVPYGLLALCGIRPSLILQARGINLIYQYWIHTDVIRRIGPLEEVLNTPSHHRVHHGSNRQYLDRNHGSILISWDRLFGTFAREEEPVVYGLTKNIETFNLARVMTHEHGDILRDVAGSDNWSDRLSFVVRGPGWAYARHAEQAAAALEAETAAEVEIPAEAEAPAPVG
ncbi:MAG: sterol desaturase family protein [Acidimicrobiales bacterium]|nr:sterol desaturase family protein [Acidimicrobiales bacterium]